MSTRPPDAPTDVSVSAEEEPGVEGVSIRRRAMAGVALIGLRGVAIRALGFLSSLALARLLTPNDFGTLAFGQSLIGFADLLGDVGIAAALLRRPAPPTRREVKAVLAFQETIVLTVTAMTVAFGLASGTQVGQVTALIVCSMPIAVFRTPTTIRLERDLLYGRLAFAEIFEVVTYIVVAITATALGAGVWGVAAAIVARAVAGTGYLLARDPQRVLLPRPDFAVIRGLLRFGIQFQLNGVILTIRSQGVNVVTGSVGGLGVLGIWDLAQRLMSVPFLLFDSLSRVTMPAISRLLDQGEDPVPDLARGLGVGSILTGTVLVALSASSPLLVPALFGPEWSPAAPVIPLASLGLIFVGPISACCGGFLLARGDAATNVRASLLSVVAWAAVAFPLLDALGPSANGLGWLAASLAETVVLLSGLRKVASLPVVSIVWVPTAAAVVVGGPSYFLAPSLPDGLLSAVLLSLAATVAYVLVLYLVRREAVVDALRLGRRSLGLAMRRGD